jgi:hypothetical protein
MSLPVRSSSVLENMKYVSKSIIASSEHFISVFTCENSLKRESRLCGRPKAFLCTSETGLA